MGGAPRMFFPFSCGRRGPVGVGCCQQVTASAGMINSNINELGVASGPINTEVQNGPNAGGAPAGFRNFGVNLNAPSCLKKSAEEVALRMVAGDEVTAPGANKGVVSRGVQGLWAGNTIAG